MWVHAIRWIVLGLCLLFDVCGNSTPNFEYLFSSKKVPYADGIKECRKIYSEIASIEFNFKVLDKKTITFNKSKL